MKVDFLEVRVECLLKGALMTIKASGAPDQVLEQLAEIDPDVKFRDSFPTYRRGGGSKKDVKSGRIITVIIKNFNGQKSYDLVCSTDSEGDQNVKVSRKKAGEFQEELKAHLPEEKKDGIDSSSGVIMLADQPVEITYFEIEGNRYFDSFGGEK